MAFRKASLTLSSYSFIEIYKTKDNSTQRLPKTKIWYPSSSFLLLSLLHNQSTSKSYHFYFKNIFQIRSFITNSRSFWVQPSSLTSFIILDVIYQYNIHVLLLLLTFYFSPTCPPESTPYVASRQILLNKSEHTGTLLKTHQYTPVTLKQAVNP